MSTQHGSAAGPPPTPVQGLPPRQNGKPWYPTLKDAIEAWAHENDLHGEHKVPDVYVYLHYHIGGWSVE
jgi:hypothetical protein